MLFKVKTQFQNSLTTFTALNLAVTATSDFPCFPRILTLLTVFTLMMLVTSQVTFSRDWTGGKRSPPTNIDCGQFTKLCKRLIHDIKQVMTSQKFGKHRRVEDDFAGYDDDK
ncbi:unnamed protein product [Leptosia nina]|uniref:Uncharacterized protein n=1 Tax=Leptosia nina TaxID=320188 RepID=A0AAV1J503_9NEOP